MTEICRHLKVLHCRIFEILNTFGSSIVIALNQTNQSILEAYTTRPDPRFIELSPSTSPVGMWEKTVILKSNRQNSNDAFYRIAFTITKE